MSRFRLRFLFLFGRNRAGQRLGSVEIESRGPDPAQVLQAQPMEGKPFEGLLGML